MKVKIRVSQAMWAVIHIVVSVAIGFIMFMVMLISMTFLKEIIQNV